MKKIDIFMNKEENLVLHVFEQGTSRTYPDIYDEQIEKYLELLSKHPIQSVEMKSTKKQETINIKYSDCILQLHDLENIGKKDEYLKPLYLSFVKYNERKSVETLKERDNKIKVTRENKYSNKKIIALVTAAGIFITSGAISLGRKKEKVENNIEPMSIASLDESYDDDYEMLPSAPSMPSEPLTPINEDEVLSFENTNIENINTITVGAYNVVDSSGNEIILEYDDLSNTNKAIYAKENYGDIIEKYSNLYGIDPKIMLGIATHERGVHATVKDKGGATGLMQIQNSVWVGHEISAYNFQLGDVEKITVTEDMLSDLETNIKLGCMVFQNGLNYVNYNIPMAIQTYNFGIGNMNTVINAYASDSGQTREEVINNPCDIGWTEYRHLIKVGDKNYLNGVLSWLGNDNDLYVTKTDNTQIALTIRNNLVVNKSY